MKHPFPCTLRRAAFACLAFTLLSLAHPGILRGQTDLGTLTGRVSNAATGANLEGAVVRLDGAGVSTRTARDGIYRLQAAPGNYEIVVTYTGLDRQSAPVRIESGSAMTRDFGLTSAIYEMAEYTVSGEREGNALAITLQRHSEGVVNIVSADAFGNLAGNPADLLMRMPGIAGESVGGDTRFIRIRGMHHNLSSVSIDGNRMADAASAGATREVQWQQSGTEVVERVEVAKAPTPDMAADSIGGAVNIVTKSAFDRSPQRRIGGSVGYVWRPTDERSRPMRQATISYSEVFADRIGITFNYGHQPVESLIDGTQQVHQAVPNDSDGPAYTQRFFMRDQRNKRTRWGGGLRFDYKYSDSSRFFLNTIMNKHDEHANLPNANWVTAANVATVDPVTGELSAGGHIMPGYTEDMTEWRPLINSRVEAIATATHKIGKQWNFQFGGVHRFGGMDVDYDAYHSNSKTVYPHNRTFTLTARNIGMRIERRDEPFRPVITQIAGPDITDINSYTQNHYNVASSSGRDEYWGSSINVKRQFDTPVPTYLKTGLRVREQTRDLTRTPWTGSYIGPDLAQFVNPEPQNVIHGGRYPLVPYPAFPGRDTPGSARTQYAGHNVQTVLDSNPELFERNTAADLQNTLIGDTSFEERITSGYIMGNAELGKLTVLGGLRVEETKLTGEGARSEITPEEAARRAAWEGDLTEEEIIRRTIAEHGNRERRSGNYTNVFPGLHLKYEITPGFITRLSWSTNIGRPNIGQLVPRTTVNYENERISTSNPNLKPQYADNFDFSAEYYFEPAGLVSAGVFLKELDQFIFTQGGALVGSGPDNGFGGAYEGYELTTQYNGGAAKIKGFELSYMQQFTFLPGWLNGFGAFANYTWLKAEGNYGAGNAININLVNQHTNEVAQFIPETGNAGISYIKNRISLRFQFNHVGRFLNSYNNNRSRLLYRKARSTVDIKTMFQITRNIDFYMDVSNVLSEADRALEYWGGRPQRMDKMFPQVFFGVRGRM